MKLTISDEIKKLLPDFRIIAYTMEVNNKKTKTVTDLLTNEFAKYYHIYELTTIVNLPIIKEARDGYKCLGKDPSHTRLACEALLRRVVKDGTLYRISDLVDLGNLLSIKTRRSICVVDKDKVIGDINIRLGNENDDYNTINRGKLNVNHIPLYEDYIGPFGNPTSDTPRTMITDETKQILIMMICFDKIKDESEKWLVDIYREYAQAKNICKIGD